MKTALPLLAVALSCLLAATARAQSVLIPANATWSFLHPTTGVDPAIADTDFGTTWYTFGASYNGPAFTINKIAPFYYSAIDYFATYFHLGTVVTATADGPVSINLGAVPPTRFLFRIRPVP